MTETVAGIPIPKEEPLPIMAVSAPVAMTQIPKIRSITVDTFTAFQKNQVFDKWEDGKIKIDQWLDYGVDMVQFVRQLNDLGFICVGIVGGIGTGKSFGMKYLPSKTNIWFNADNKDATYRGGQKEYGPKESPNYLQVVATTYDDVITKVKKVQAAGLLEKRPIAFLIGHTEEYKSGEVMRQRLKTIGKISKMEIEDMLTMCYYTDVTPSATGAIYRLRTQNNGFNNCRTKEGQHKDLFINNDFNEIIKSIDSYE